ncbi:MAG: glucuronate isomerase [Bacteroidota bacterium]
MISNGTNIKEMSSVFLGEDFLLDNEYSILLYHQYAKDLPIIDYHNHLPPQAIAVNKQYQNITQIWLYGDHYKWRAMRANGINERYITGDASDWKKFEQYALTLPYTLRNPLYHWSHLELKRYFGIDELLTPKTAQSIYDQCNLLLNTEEYAVQHLLKKMKVELLCTTDDPTDDLSFHQMIAQQSFGIRVLPTFRPDKAILIEQAGFTEYIEHLSEVADTEIEHFQGLIDALHKRMDFFHEHGCRLADHGLEKLETTDFSLPEVDRILTKKRKGQAISKSEAAQYQSAVLHHLGVAYHTKNWTMQLHLGALRNNNSRLLGSLGPDTGFDSIGDFSQAQSLSKFLNRLDASNQLAKTILYNLNPRDNEVFAAMAGNFQDGTIVGKIQYGSGWWFLDQLDGMEKQINALSNMGLLSRFIGMLTDSRSFLSYPRHEYFRRLLCNIFGKDLQGGRLPKDLDWIGKVIQDICYYNAKNYFSF